MLPDSLPPDSLRDVLTPLGLPAPAHIGRVKRDGCDGPTLLYRVRFASERALPDHFLQLETDRRPRPTVSVHLGALRLARSSGLPLPEARRLDGLRFPALLLSGVEGRPDPDHDAVPKHLVDVLLALESIQTPSWGDTVVDGAFVPSAASWSGFIGQRLDAAAAQAERTDCALGSLARSLRAAAHDELDALEGAPTGLVHGNLIPGVLLIGDDGALGGVLDWHTALLGDPLLDWVTAFEAPSGALARGLGDRRSSHLLAPTAPARLRVYLRLRALERLAECGRSWLDGDGGRLRSGRLEVARILGEDALDGRRVQARLDSLTGTRPDPTLPDPPGKQAMLRRRLFEALRHPLSATGLPFASAFAAVFFDDADKLAEQSSTLLRGATSQIGAWAAAPISDRSAWRTELVDSLDTADPTRGIAVALCALGLAAVDAVSDRVEDASLRGLERLVRTVRHSRPTWRDAVVGSAGCVALGLDGSGLRAGLAEVPEGDGDPEDIVDGLVFTDWLKRDDAAWVPLLAWAIQTLPAEGAGVPDLRERLAAQLLDDADPFGSL
jgi:hypothetical protein